MTYPPNKEETIDEKKPALWKSGAGFGNLELWEDISDSSVADGSDGLGNKIAAYHNDKSAPWNPFPSVGGGKIHIYAQTDDGEWSERAVDEIVLTCTAIVHLYRRLGAQMVPHW